MSPSVAAHLGLGSNLGDRIEALRSAVAALARRPGITVTAQSGVHETEAVGPPGQGRYLNAAVAIRTWLGPHELLRTCLEIEAEHGRRRHGERRWGPRPLDVDLLLYGGRVIEAPGLSVPHPRLHERPFVLEPLAEIAADVVHPVLERSVESLRDALRARV